MKRAKRDEKMQQVIQKLIAKIDADPYDQESYYALGTALTEEKSFTQAEELFKKALNALSDRAEKTELLHYGLGNVLEAFPDFQSRYGHRIWPHRPMRYASSPCVPEHWRSTLARHLSALPTHLCDTYPRTGL